MTKTNLEDKLREIIHRRWEIDDEVGLFIEIKALLQQRMDEIEGEVKNIKVFATSEDFEIKAEICTAVWEKVFKPKVLNIIKSVDKNNEN